MADNTVRVVIYDQVYHIRPAAGAELQQIERLAGFVDARMRAIAAGTRDVDSLRVAVLAALHIADQYESLKAHYEELRAAVSDKSAEFSRLLDAEIRRSIER